MRPASKLMDKSMVITTVSRGFSALACAYAVRRAGPAAAATNTSEMARRFRTAVVSMGRPRVIGVGRPHAPGLFRDDGVKRFEHTVP